MLKGINPQYALFEKMWFEVWLTAENKSSI
jgi:hypothetical protein